MSNKLLVVIGGPTGIGKTALAIRLALHYHSEVISADSRQVYAELNIGVGRPTAEELAAVPHHLIGHVHIQDHYTAGIFAKEVLALLEVLFQKHNIIFLSGGTGLYVRALMEGLDNIPEVPSDIVDRWTHIWKEEGTTALVLALKDIDPDYFNIVDHGNPMRLIRALSVTEASGKPFSSFLKGQKAERSFDVLPIVLEIPREELYEKINNRVVKMISTGWLDEVKSLLPYRDLKALQTVGYKELIDHLDGNISLEDAISAIQQSTRRYAKRQMTWWRHQGEWIPFHPKDIDSINNTIDSRLNQIKSLKTHS